MNYLWRYSIRTFPITITKYLNQANFLNATSFGDWETWFGDWKSGSLIASASCEGFMADGITMAWVYERARSHFMIRNQSNSEVRNPGSLHQVTSLMCCCNCCCCSNLRLASLSPQVSQTGFEFSILLLQSLGLCDYGCAPPYLARQVHSNCSTLLWALMQSSMMLL